jgi:UDP-2,3-diacylglucosamine pyrophosphatase LpxH
MADKLYKRYNISFSPDNVFIIGDLHGKFNFLMYKIRLLNLRDVVIIVAGDCGFGFESVIHYQNLYNSFKDTLLERNVHLIFVRGNHDDPNFFDGEQINFDNFIAVPDYSILTFDDNHNVLCVGGATSVDRIWRIEQQTVKKPLYWTNEFPIYSPEILDEICIDGIQINTIVTHTSPSFAPLTSKTGIETFLMYDPSLNEAISYERLTINNIHDHLLKDKHPIEKWVYGHFHQHATTEFNDIKFVMLDACALTNNNTWDIEPLKSMGENQ